jgi:hypothetical protein
LDIFLGVLLVSVIYSAQIHTMIICIVMEVFTQVQRMGWIGSYSTFVGDVALEKSKLECKVCHSTLVYIALCHACIRIYVHSTSP